VLPPEFARYHALFHEFSARQAKRWKPQWIELDLTRADQYSMSADEERLAPFPWPKGWPSLDDEQSVRTGDYYATVFLPGKAERRLSSIYGWKAEEKAYGIALDGTRWIIEHWKAVFPGACSWEAVIAARGGVGS
jgi:hypothetical protein